MHRRRLLSLLLVGVSFAALAPAPPPCGAADATCGASGSTALSGSQLDTGTPVKSGVVYDSSGGGKLKLGTAAGTFNITTLGMTARTEVACAADFNGDGWTDFVGDDGEPGGAGSHLRFFRNDTGSATLNPPLPTEADWANPAYVRVPRFTPSTILDVATVTYGGGVACADFNNDGKQDFAIVRRGASGANPMIWAYLHLGNGNGTFQPRYQFLSSLGTPCGGSTCYLGQGTELVAWDYNGDGRQDLLLGVAQTSADATANGGGKISVLLNNGAAPPMFNTVIHLVTDIGFGAFGPSAMAVEDFTGDGKKDVIAAGVDLGGASGMRLYPGVVGGLGTPQSIGFGGSGAFIVSGDFRLSGRMDLIVGTDNNGPGGTHFGGQSWHYKNDGDITPFSGPTTTKLTHHDDSLPLHGTGKIWDYDGAFAMDYDHDPSNTLDAFVMDDDSNTYRVFANRALSQFVTCGTVESGPVDLGGVTGEFVITTARIDPTQLLPAGGSPPASVGWEASNNGGNTWTPATACPDDPAEYCATFTSSFGNDLRWRATLCSDSTHTKTPEISMVGIEFQYVAADNHYRAGPVAKNGAVFQGAFRHPGDQGKFFAIDETSGGVMWEAGALIDAATARTLYTTTAAGVRHDFSTASASNTTFQSILNVGSSAEASSLVTWWTGSRFGVSLGHKFGSVENSTAAVMGAPRPPYWYNYTITTAAERTAIDDFVEAKASRSHLVFVGSKDGALHAFETASGTERWALIPYDVAQRLAADKVLHDAGSPLTAYPDGAPTLNDAKLSGAWATVLVSGEGNGGRSVFAIDVTDPSDPDPLWTFTDDNMGRTFSKPAVVRAKVGGAETWLAIFASGPASGFDVGDSVYAVNLQTGALAWEFDIGDSNCYVATAITAVETDDTATGESGTPAIDGFIDRVVFADNKGRVWKLSVDSGAALGSVNVPVVVPNALFSTSQTADALGLDRSIGGTIAAEEDATGRLALYFGTGGTEDSPDGVQNYVFKVYADDGSIANCGGSACKIGAPEVPVGHKFYGGVAVSGGQIVFATTNDSTASGLCDATTGGIHILNANTMTADFGSVSTGAQVAGPLYVAGGRVYAVTGGGDLLLVGDGTGTAAGGGDGGAGGGAGGGAFSISGWRQLQ